MRRWLILLLASTLVWPQASNFTTAPSGDTIEGTEVLSTTAQRVCSRSSLAITRTSGTVLTLGTGASATDPQWIRTESKSYSVTAATTTITASGTGTGNIHIYARVAAGALTLYAGHNVTGLTLTCAGSPGCTVQVGRSSMPKDAIPLWTWNVTTGQYDTTFVSDFQANADCWIDLVEFTVNSTPTAVTLQDAQATPQKYLDATALPANSLTIISVPGGAFMASGATISAAADGNITMRWRVRRRIVTTP